MYLFYYFYKNYTFIAFVLNKNFKMFIAERIKTKCFYIYILSLKS